MDMEEELAMIGQVSRDKEPLLASLEIYEVLH